VGPQLEEPWLLEVEHARAVRLLYGATVTQARPTKTAAQTLK